MTRAYRMTPESRARKAENLRRILARLWQTPAYREKMLTVIQRNAHHPAFIAARGKGFHTLWADPEKRAAWIAAHTKWTPEDDAFLREFYGRITAREIAGLTGVTRKAVIGRAHRLGLCKPAGNRRRAA